MRINFKDKTIRFLTASLILVSILCAFIFSFLAFFMGNQSRNTLNEVGTIYMSSMSEQISLHFETTMNLRLSQVQALTTTTPPEQNLEEEGLRQNLAFNAQARGFDYLGFYLEDQTLDTIYGQPATVIDPDPFYASICEKKEKIAVATNSAGEKIVLLAFPCNYSLSGGRSSIALVAGLPVDYINTTLSLDKTDDSLAYSYIIRMDGTFVIRGSDVVRESYFDRIRTIFGEEFREEAEASVRDLSAAMAACQNYSNIFRFGNERRHVYCTPLAYSEWYLVTIMPYNSLNLVINRLNWQWGIMTFISCGMVLALLILIFVKYLTLSQKQIRQLEKAKAEAIKAQHDALAAKEEAIQANKAKSEFLSNMSHDIRTPMNAIVGMTAIAITNLNNPQQIQNCLKKISLSSKHLLGLINDVLDMSKIESGKMSLNMDQVSLREVMDSIVSITQPQIKMKKQRFDVFIHDISAENVCGDSVQLNQILLNILSNAIKFTPEGGQIHLSLFEETSPKGDDFIRVHITVKDTGIGMTKEFKDKIFESFSREDRTRVHKTEGTGLGMTITKYIVDAMGGTIDVWSEQGAGTEFRVTLDLEKAEIMEEDMLLPQWNMLVVDDDEQLCRSAAASLHSIGVNAEWTLDGETAVQMVEERHQKHDDYHIILLDWKLPGMDGLQTAREIRKRIDESSPILLISAYDWSEIETDARSVGINGFIAKPLFKSTLFYSLKAYAADAPVLTETAMPESGEDLGGRHILVAEDNDLNWEIADELLSELNLILERAENGQMCVEKFKASPVGFYDAIIMDIRMPIMTGYEAAVAIRKLNRPDAQLPIIAMTADAFSEDIKHCLDCGMNAHTAKPIDVREITRLLKKFLNIQ